MKRERKNAGSSTLMDKSGNIIVNMPEFMSEFKPGYGKGKTAAIICMTKYISLSSKLIFDNKEFYNHIKFLQRKAIYTKYSEFCNDKTKKYSKIG